ncbi:MAG TPA: carbohydrate ABC transporter permease [Clostridia bacterium]|nr:carbohydrate ABC transporter permease [Clostridia bacterium]
MVGTMTPGRRLFIGVNTLFLLALSCVMLYPFLYVIAASFSSDVFILTGSVGILPKGFTTGAYGRVFNYPMIWRSYGNTLLYTFFGTLINIALTSLGAYPLSRKQFYGRTFFTFFVAFTMWFNAGMIPTFLVVRSYKMYNTLWAILLPGAISTYNMIVMRTFFQQIPVSLEEAALIDGCNDVQTLLRIIVPLSFVTISLFYAVGHWNSFMSALIYLRDKNKFPLQMILRDVVIQNQLQDLVNITESMDVNAESVKFATIVTATLPILCIYPFIQKYFVKGVMIGALKDNKTIGG